MAFIVGLLTGFLMCIPVGPINLFVINVNFKRNSREAISLAAGGSLMDFTYFFLILSGLSFLNLSPQVMYYTKLVGISFIFFIGIKDLLFFKRPEEDKQSRKLHSSRKMVGAFLLGMFIYVSNPTLLFSMTALATFIKSLELFTFHQFNIIWLSFGLALGSLGWFAFLVRLSNKYKEKIVNDYLKRFNQLSGILMIALSLYMFHGLLYKRDLI